MCEYDLYTYTEEVSGLHTLINPIILKWFSQEMIYLIK